MHSFSEVNEKVCGLEFIRIRMTNTLFVSIAHINSDHTSL